MKKSTVNTPALGTEKKKYPYWFYLIALLIPVVLIVILEIALRIGGYGVTYKIFDSVDPEHPELLFLNPDIAAKYFVNLNNPPATIPDGFEKMKGDKTFRVFVLGESSTAGWPYIPNASFPRHLKRKLELYYPDNKIEVVNLGMSAICSYTLRDFAKAAAVYEPDLVMIYTGHNEYYGALGVASTQSVAGLPFLNKLYLDLIEYRIVQLIRNTILWMRGAVTYIKQGDNTGQNETLMSRMVGGNLVPLNSSLYKAGLKQFESNLTDIIEIFKERNVPIIISTVASNLSGIKPFESVNEEGLPRADKIYYAGTEQLKRGDTVPAKKSFTYAKDLDALRFRAPSDINEIVKRLASLNSVPLADAESVFNSFSPGGITGNNLMVDHLHPDINGYKLIADEFFRVMRDNKLLPVGKAVNISDKAAEKILSDEFPFTGLDSTIAELRIRILTSGYPFKPKSEVNELIRNFKPATLTDSLAMKVVDRIYTLDEAHGRLAERYWELGNFTAAAKEINVLTSERPFKWTNHEQLVEMLISAKRVDLALPYLLKYHKINPCAYTTKWLGAIYLDRGDHASALPYLQKSYELKSNDPQVLYNLAGAYYLSGKLREAFEAIKQCLRINPGNPAARAFYSQLHDVVD